MINDYTYAHAEDIRKYRVAALLPLFYAICVVVLFVVVMPNSPDDTGYALLFFLIILGVVSVGLSLQQRRIWGRILLEMSFDEKKISIVTVPTGRLTYSSPTVKMKILSRPKFAGPGKGLSWKKYFSPSQQVIQVDLDKQSYYWLVNGEAEVLRLEAELEKFA